MMTVQVNSQAQPAIFQATVPKIVHRVTIHNDHDPESPREWDNLGTMYCEHRRYTLGDKKAQDISVYDHKTEQRITPEKGYTILPLYLYDHSGITMNTTGFSCGWDSGQVGYIYVSDEKVRKEYGWKVITKKRRAMIAQYLKNEVEVYDQYLTGDCWGFEYQSFAVYPDGTEEPQDDEDSCWGFFGHDPADNGIEAHLPVKLADCEVTRA